LRRLRGEGRHQRRRTAHPTHDAAAGRRDLVTGRNGGRGTAADGIADDVEDQDLRRGRKIHIRGTRADGTLHKFRGAARHPIAGVIAIVDVVITLQHVDTVDGKARIAGAGGCAGVVVACREAACAVALIAK